MRFSKYNKLAISIFLVFSSIGLIGQAPEYYIKAGLEFSIKDYHEMANESLAKGGESILGDRVRLTSIAPIIEFPLYKTNKAKKLRPSFITGFAFSIPKNFEVKKNSGEVYIAKVKSNQIFLRAQIDYYFSYIGLRGLAGYHFDFLNIDSKNTNQGNFAYGGALLIGFPFKKDVPKVFGAVLTLYKTVGFKYYWLISLQVPVTIKK